MWRSECALDNIYHVHRCIGYIRDQYTHLSKSIKYQLQCKLCFLSLSLFFCFFFFSLFIFRKKKKILSYTILHSNRLSGKEWYLSLQEQDVLDSNKLFHDNKKRNNEFGFFFCVLSLIDPYDDIFFGDNNNDMQ